MMMTLPHAKMAVARQLLAALAVAAEHRPADGALHHAHDVHLESRRLFISLIVAILCGSAQRTARRAPLQPEASLPVKEVHEQEPAGPAQAERDARRRPGRVLGATHGRRPRRIGKRLG